METGFIAKAMGSYLEDDPHSALSIVLAVLDGQVREFADADSSGRWIDVRFHFSLPDGSIGSARPRDRGGDPAAQTFGRRIPGWGEPPARPAPNLPAEDPTPDPTPHDPNGLRFLSLEEAVRLGVTDEEGNFLE